MTIRPVFSRAAVSAVSNIGFFGLFAIWLALSVLALTCCGEARAASVLKLETSQHYYHLDEYAGYYEDPSGQLDIAAIGQVPEASWQKIPDISPGFGFSDSAYWFRINLEVSARQQWLLEIDDPLLDEINFYLFSGEALLQEVRTGDSRPFIERPLQAREFILPLELPEAGQATLYLRVKSSGSVQVPMNLWGESRFYERDEVETAALGIYFGAILVMLLYNLFLYLRVQEPAYIYYVLYIAMFGLFMVGLSGWGYQYLWPNAPGFQQYGLALFIILGDIVVCRFIQYFLHLPEQAPRIGRVLSGVALALFILLCLLPFSSYNAIVQAALVLTIAIALIALYAGVRLWRAGDLGARYFTLAWGAFLVAVVLAILERFAVLPVTYWADLYLPAGMVLELILLSLALGEQINSEKQRRIQAQEQLIQVQMKSQKELEQKVSERTFELKEANAQLERLAITDGLTGIYNLRHFLELGARLLETSKRYQHPIAVIMMDIDRFKSVNDEHGHAAGDEVLKQVVATCCRSIRNTDVIGRLGGEEFGILLLETEAADAQVVAERIRHAMTALSVDYGGEAISVSVSQGICAIAPAQQYPALEQMLKMADAALYQAKASGRNRVVLGDNTMSGQEGEG